MFSDSSRLPAQTSVLSMWSAVVYSKSGCHWGDYELRIFGLLSQEITLNLVFYSRCGLQAVLRLKEIVSSPVK